MPRRLFSLLISLTASAALIAACGGGGGDSTEPDATAPAESTSAAASTPAGTATPASGRFEQAGLVDNWQPSSQPDPSRVFATTFPASAQELDVVFKLTAGPAGDVYSAWKYKGEWVVLPGMLKTPVTPGQWASFTFSKPSGSKTFDAGDYEVILGMPGETATRAIKFTITPVASSARLEQVGLVKKWDANVPPETSSFVTSFGPTDGNVYAVFKLAAGNAGQVTTTWKHAGKVLEFGEQPRIEVEGGRWGTLYMFAPDFPTGDYEVDIALTGTSDKRTLKFTIGAAAPATRPKFDQAGILPTAPNTPDPATFATALKPTDQQANAYFRLTPATDTVWVTGQWKFQGSPIYLVGRSTPMKGTNWASVNLRAGSGLPPGDYECVLTIPGSEETRSLKFTVR